MTSRHPGAPIRSISIDEGQAELDRWPYTLPVVAQIAEQGLKLDPGVTILVGQNGAGKSTLVEALAAAWGRRTQGLHHDWVQAAAAMPSKEDSDLNRSLRLELTTGGTLGGFFLRAEKLHSQADWFKSRGRWNDRMSEPDILSRSHGEGFLEILAAMLAEPGFYVLDEPESALSFDSCLVLLTLMGDMRAAGSQVVLATHSPILAALPGATILQIDQDGIYPVDYDETDLVMAWRSFLNAPAGYLRHLT